MRTTDPSLTGEIDPRLLLNPEYWGGHSIGIGETEPQPIAPVSGATSVRNRLQSTLRDVDQPSPLAVLDNGEVFDPKEHAPGTVVLLHEEGLIATPEAQAVDPDQLRFDSVPDRPSAIPERFGFGAKRDPVEIGESFEGITYSLISRWGIVVERGRKDQSLYTVPAHVIQNNGNGIVVAGMPKPHKASVKTGETTHTRDARGGERLARVNLLEIMALGQQRGKVSERSPYASVSRALAELG